MPSVSDFVLLVAWGLGLAGDCSDGFAQEPTAPLLLNQRCGECHNAEVREGGLDLAAVPWSLHDVGIRGQWVRIFDRIDKGEMPPQSVDLPESERKQLREALGASLYEADHTEVLAQGRGPLRRLNREEFEQNLRDVLEMPELDIRGMLPEDRTSLHFNKTSEVLDLSRVQLMAYLDATEVALRQAMASGITAPPTMRYRGLATQMFQEAETFGNREAMFYAKDSQLLPLDGGSLAALRQNGNHDPAVELAIFRSAHWPYYGYPDGFIATLPGRYRVRFSARAVVQREGYRLEPATVPVPMTFRARKRSGPDVSGDVRATGGWIDIQPTVAEYETTIQLRENETFEYSLLGLPVPLARNVNNGPPEYRYPPLPAGGQPGIAYQWIEVEGPLSSPTWPPLSHRALFGELPIRVAASEGSRIEVVSEHPREEALQLLHRFIERAARQPVSSEDILPFDQLVLTRLERGDAFSEALLAGYKAFLCSGHFLYLFEPRKSEDHAAIASRMSHFLTNSRPDAALQDRARKQELRTDSVLRLETDRLIDSLEFERFVTNFTDNWLNLKSLYRDEPDIRLYPEYRFDDYLVESMERETRAYWTAMVRENLPAVTIVDSDFVWVNDRLARHYELPLVSGSAVRKVSLPQGSPYGGILTQAAILKVSANGTSTSPVIRGAWVMDRLIGEPPPPPPPNVPAVEPDIRGAKTIRDLLAAHTQSSACAGCHARFDPVGVALENFDILGHWRTRYRGVESGEPVTGIDRAGHDFSYALAGPVDASGQLRDGRAFREIHELKAHLAANPRQLARNLLSQFTVYATGTPVRFSDRREVELILDQCHSDGYRVRDLLHAFIQSPIFLGLARSQTP